jgi:hypothetical protein
MFHCSCPLLSVSQPCCVLCAFAESQRGSNGSSKRTRTREPLVQAKRLMRQASQLEADLEVEQENTWQGFLVSG